MTRNAKVVSAALSALCDECYANFRTHPSDDDDLKKVYNYLQKFLKEEENTSKVFLKNLLKK